MAWDILHGRIGTVPQYLVGMGINRIDGALKLITYNRLEDSMPNALRIP